MSDPNPYESPKEVSSPPTVKAGVAIGLLLLLSIPAGCVCGGITCTQIQISLMESNEGKPEDSFLLLGFFAGIFVAVLVPVLAVRLFGKKKA